MCQPMQGNASKEKLKFIKNNDLGWIMGVAKNRKVSINGRDYTQVPHLEIPNEGLIVYLNNFGKVKVVCKIFTNEEQRHYIIYLPNENALIKITKVDFLELHSIHWGIECYHITLKQVCGIERFMVRTTQAIKTHFSSAIRAFTQLELMRSEELIENWYELHRKISLHVARDFILEHLKQKLGANPHGQLFVNA